MKTKTLSPELLHKMDAYWRAANYLSVGQIYLYDNPLMSESGQAETLRGTRGVDKLLPVSMTPYS